jgi:pseudaminic acid biosynthesis-associated methylase
MSSQINEQEKFWAGKFGDDYIGRNKSDVLHSANLNLFSQVLRKTHSVCSISEFGCNIGMNLKALRSLLPNAYLHGYEINQLAINYLVETQPDIITHRQSILEKIDLEADLTFTKGVLIHIHPDHLPDVYDNLYRNAKRYILLAEYYDPKPVSLSYRGHDNKMFKRDFAGELLDRYSDLRLLDYGFCYHRDNNFPQDDINWFIMEKV